MKETFRRFIIGLKGLEHSAVTFGAFLVVALGYGQTEVCLMVFLIDFILSLETLSKPLLQPIIPFYRYLNTK